MKKSEVIMKSADRQKMCPNCDGRIPYEATQCPYCFTPVQVESSQPSLFKNQSIQDSLTNVFTPPYSSKSEPEEKKTPFRAPEDAVMAKAAPMAQVDETSVFWPVLLLSLAGNLFTLGILQFFFSENGIVKLEISSAYWFLMVLVALPLFFFGIRFANKLK